ncbi:MAG: alpha-E domain-containing protein [Chromatiales bacterium]|nr:alpha-E domain-containing protein [Gammaproteobacteria bacterium]MCP5351717.1 alpha-E domain-containing protein [Chromatiales bacterium]
MLSRVAETLYWFGRYIERAENTARIVSVNTNLLLDLPGSMAPGWAPLITLLGADQDYADRHPEVTEMRVVNFLLSDSSYSGSIISTLEYARENMRTIREVLPREAWEAITSLHNRAPDFLRPNLARHDRHGALNRVIFASQHLTGLLTGTMNHDIGYQFLNLGRKIERADMTTRIVDMRWENPLPEAASESDLEPFDDVLWMTILKSLSGYQMYRRSRGVRINRGDVLGFLFQSMEFPRALAYCVEVIIHDLHSMPNHVLPLEAARRLRHDLLSSHVDKMPDGQLHHFIDDLQLYIAKLHTLIAETYFLAPPEMSQSQSQVA